MNRAETVQLLAFITAFYPDWKLTEATIEAWHEMLRDLEFEVAKTAVKRVI
ncbi:MAG: replicative helicase loader/inhibitor, partial [Bacillota bacterium]